MSVEFQAVSKAFGQQRIIEQFDLRLEQGKMVTLLGPSGCGKTTLLRLLAGLETPDAGRILIDGVDVTHTPIQSRNIGIVFQSYALFPHLTVGENIAFGLKMQKMPAAERAQKVQQALEWVELAGLESRFIDQLSGGQQQRVALARALVMAPSVLLFDEPLSNLDANLRRQMREMIRRLQQQLAITALYVTHDQAEAFAVADEVVVMQAGKICQRGSAQQLYQQPNSAFIARFMGESTLFTGTQRAGRFYFSGSETGLALPESVQKITGECRLGVRPEAVRLASKEDGAWRASLVASRFMGSYWEAEFCLFGQPLLAHLREPLLAGDYALSFDPNGIFCLPPEREA